MGMRIFVQLCLFVALSAASWITWHVVTRQPVPGCGANSGCDAVLSSRWASWLGVPVSGLGAATYLLMFLAMQGVQPQVSVPVQRSAWMALTCLAMVAGGAAVWFLTIQIVVIKQLCVYCLAAHVAALLASGCILSYTVTARAFDAAAGEALIEGRDVLTSAGSGAGLAMMLVMGQVLHSPDRVISQPLAVPPSTTVAAVKPPPPEEEPAATGKTAPQLPVRRKSFHFRFSGPPPGNTRWDLDLYDHPVLGHPEAPKQVVEVIDYTCPHCRELYGKLTAAHGRFGQQLSIVVVLAPLNKDCNRYIVRTDDRHLDACDAAKLALAVYRADRDKFPEFHHWLMEGLVLPTVKDMRVKAAELVGAQQLLAAERDTWVEKKLETCVEIFKDFGADSLPMVLVFGKEPRKYLHFDTAEKLAHILRYDLDLSPLSGP